MAEDSTRVWYETERKAYAVASSNHLERFEKALLIASGGGFAGTASAVAADPNWLNIWIVLSFLMLGLSFLSVLIGHYLSHLSNENAIYWLDANPNPDVSTFRSKYTKSITGLNVASIGFLVIGFGLILTSGVIKMSDERGTGGSTWEERGAAARRPSSPPSNNNLAPSPPKDSSDQAQSGGEKSD